MKTRITKRLVDSLKPPPKGQVRAYDDSLRGFGLVVTAGGTKSFFVEYGPENRRRRMTLGQYGALTVEQARTMAEGRLGDVAKGTDPLSAREAARQVPTFGRWMDEYMAGVRRRKKQPRHDERYLGMAKARWGTRTLTEITRRDVQAAMEDMAARGQTTANRWLASLRACLQAAVKADLIHENPAMGTQAFREAAPRARVLTDDEFARAVQAIDGLADPYLRCAFLLLMDTGARKSEVLGARWDDMDLDSGTWRLPSPKAGIPQVIPLAPQTVDLLRSMERMGPWVVPGRDPANHAVDLKRPWERIRKGADLEGVTIHDLRRTFGLHVARRAGLHVASKLLRHSDIRVTERVYAPLGLDTLREAVAEIQRERGKVVELRKGGR